MPNRRLKDIVAGQDLVAASPDDTVRSAANRMQGRHVGAVLVMDDGELKGIFTGTNLMRNVLEPGLNPELVEIGEVMTPDPLCLDGDALAFEAVRLMRDYNIRHVVVRLDAEDDNSYGMVSVRDFPAEEMVEFEEEFAFEQQVWEEL